MRNMKCKTRKAIAVPGCCCSDMKKSTSKINQTANLGRKGEARHATNALNDNIGRKANTTPKNERNDACHPSRLCSASRHHRVPAPRRQRKAVPCWLGGEGA